MEKYPLNHKKRQKRANNNVEGVSEQWIACNVKECYMDLDRKAIETANKVLEKGFDWQTYILEKLSENIYKTLLK